MLLHALIPDPLQKYPAPAHVHKVSEHNVNFSYSYPLSLSEGTMGML